MENIGNQLLTRAMEYLQSAEAFAKAEVPLYLQELIQFKIVEHLLYYFDDILVLSGLIILCIFLNKKARQMPSDTRDERDTKEFFNISTIVISSFCVIILFIALCHTEHLIRAYKAYAAPRVYLIDYVKESLTSANSSSEKK